MFHISNMTHSMNYLLSNFCENIFDPSYHSMLKFQIYKNPLLICQYFDNNDLPILYHNGFTYHECKYLYDVALIRKSYQNKYIDFMQKKKKIKQAVLIIQKHFIKSYYNPHYRFCRNRLIRQFNYLML